MCSMACERFSGLEKPPQYLHLFPIFLKFCTQVIPQGEKTRACSIYNIGRLKEGEIFSTSI